MTHSAHDKQREEPPQRRARAEAVGRDASIAARAAFVRAGFSDPTLVLRWNEIAGRETARIARPLRLSEGPSGGVLTLRAEPAAALFLQHESRSLCERINAYLGRPAVAKLRFVQGPLTPLPEPQPLPKPTEPPPSDPVRRWHGPDRLGSALLGLASRRNRGRSPD
jgi:hypothetical protein